jgi:hypothetical protein
MSLQVVQRAMETVGSLADLLLIEEHIEECLWHLVVDEKTEMIAEFVEDRDVLVLTIELGKPDNLEALCRPALVYAHAWTETSAARLTLDLEGSLWIVSDLGASVLTPNTLAEAIRTAVARAQLWREIVSGTSAPLEPEPGCNPDLDVIRI